MKKLLLVLPLLAVLLPRIQATLSNQEGTEKACDRLDMISIHLTEIKANKNVIESGDINGKLCNELVQMSGHVTYIAERIKEVERGHLLLATKLDNVMKEGEYDKNTDKLIKFYLKEFKLSMHQLQNSINREEMARKACQAKIDCYRRLVNGYLEFKEAIDGIVDETELLVAELRELRAEIGCESATPNKKEFVCLCLTSHDGIEEEPVGGEYNLDAGNDNQHNLDDAGIGSIDYMHIDRSSHWSVAEKDETIEFEEDANNTGESSPIKIDVLSLNRINTSNGLESPLKDLIANHRMRLQQNPEDEKAVKNTRLPDNRWSNSAVSSANGPERESKFAQSFTTASKMKDGCFHQNLTTAHGHNTAQAAVDANTLLPEESPPQLWKRRQQKNQSNIPWRLPTLKIETTNGKQSSTVTKSAVVSVSPKQSFKPNSVSNQNAAGKVLTCQPSANIATSNWNMIAIVLSIVGIVMFAVIGMGCYIKHVATMQSHTE